MIMNHKIAKAYSARSGSALLIVLGMFAFMLVSAVSFSIYMRASRAPSSYVRRNSSARHLVKAALARAIDEIDTAIGNDPFPGVGRNHKYDEPDPNPNTEFKTIVDNYNGKNDNWHGRVFTPAGVVPAKDTVSTLTLEALGYIPPCLVNEARYWSRHTRTAKWHSFGYGLGQYAFTAINVSDFFDLATVAKRPGAYINRSSAPNGRIALPYLFRGGENLETKKNLASGDGEKGAIDFLDYLNAIPNLANVPLVSLMDFNLGSSSDYAVKPPFLGEGGGYLTSGKITKEKALSQVFIAGGYNGASNATWEAYRDAGIINLNLPEAQPFAKVGDKLQDMDSQQLSLKECVEVDDSYFWNTKCIGFEKMPALSTALLCDYLDKNSVPVSLCVPCCEAVPMLCGIELAGGVTYDTIFKVDVSTEQRQIGDVTKVYKIITHTYSLDINVKNLEAILMTTYPFLKSMPSDIQVEAVARVFFTRNSGDAYEKSRTNLDFLRMDDTFKWDLSDSANASEGYLQVNCGSRSVPEAQGDGASGAVQYPISVMGGKAQLFIDLAKFVYEEDPDTKSRTEILERREGKKSPEDFKVYEEDWKPAEIDFATVIDKDDNNNVYRPSVAIWVRVKKANDQFKTYDMVPATPLNDNLNGFSDDDESFYRATVGSGKAKLISPSEGDRSIPIIRFADSNDNGQGLIFAKTKFGATGSDWEQKEEVKSYTPVWKQKAYYANDPRINWAPEHWWVSNDAPSKDTWLKEVYNFQNDNYWTPVVKGRSDNNPDIFMSVSDQGYMQSMYEWLMIPQTRSFISNVGGSGVWGVFAQDYAEYDGIERTSKDNVAHRKIMWRTYRSDAFFPVRAKGDPGDWDSDGNNLKHWGSIDDIAFVESDNGLRVNPYTDITNIMMGAFANMPYDWWSAGTNYVNDSDKDYMDPEKRKFKKEYLFDWSTEWSPTYNFAKFWMSAFRERNKENMDRADEWKRIFDDSENVVDWSTGEIVYRPDSVQISDIEEEIGLKKDGGVMSSVDRKFLYAYLKGCFENTHQLFLVFVRAESAAGGGGAGSGARAVALVYRDPNAPKNDAGSGGESADNASKYLAMDSDGDSEESWRSKPRDYPPHKTRILFYHQLD